LIRFVFDSFGSRFIMQFLALVSAVALALFVSVAEAAAAPEATPPNNGIVESFGDWELLCPSEDTCRISQRLVAEGGGDTVFLLTALRSGADGPFVGIVSVPLRGYLAPGIELRVDAREPFQLLYETCDPAGCHAGFPLEGRVLNDFRAGAKARFRVWTAKDNPVDIDVSLIGFTRAFNALGERS
jgi:invasion protein IalB